MSKVNIIGAGRVGRTFLRLLGPSVGDVTSATRASAIQAVGEAGHGRATDLGNMRPADLWLLTVPDGQIRAAAEDLASAARAPAIAVHCSGFHRADVMSGLRAVGWHITSAHPNLSFADPAAAAAEFPGTPCGLEGDDRAVAAVDRLFRSLGAQTFRIASEQKALYHAAAVFSNNFATVLQAVARAAWQDAGVPNDIAAEMNASLLNATCANVLRQGPRDALTGPAARGDSAVVAAQEQVVSDWNSDAGALYKALSAMAVRLKSTGQI